MSLILPTERRLEGGNSSRDSLLNCLLEDYNRRRSPMPCLWMRQARSGILWMVKIRMQLKDTLTWCRVHRVMESVKNAAVGNTRLGNVRQMFLGHVSMNCPQRNKEKGKGKDSGKGKSSVVKGDWLKGKGKEKGKGKDKGKSKGKSYGKKGKLNEVNDTYDDDWWWYAASSDWDDSNWNEGYASQMSWADHEWHGSGWETWEATGNESQEQGQDGTPVVSG